MKYHVVYTLSDVLALYHLLKENNDSLASKMCLFADSYWDRSYCVNVLHWPAVCGVVMVCRHRAIVHLSGLHQFIDADTSAIKYPFSQNRYRIEFYWTGLHGCSRNYPGRASSFCSLRCNPLDDRSLIHICRRIRRFSML